MEVQIIFYNKKTEELNLTCFIENADDITFVIQDFADKFKHEKLQTVTVYIDGTLVKDKEEFKIKKTRRNKDGIS